MTNPIKLRAVQAGDDVVVAVQGGFVRRQAPCDGVLVQFGEHEIFLPEDKLTESLEQLHLLRAGAIRPKRVDPQQLDLPSEDQSPKIAKSGA